MKPATEILLSAAFVLTPEENWFGNKEAGRAGQRCALIAMGDASDVLFPDQRTVAARAAHEAFSLAIGKPASDNSCIDVIDFNDSHTHAEVLAALYKAAELSEAS